MEEHRGLWATSKQLPIIKHELRAMVPSLSYIDVRRHRLSVYDAISRELLEDGCTQCCEHFERLSNMESNLFEMRTIKIRILETQGLLEAIVENARIAERNCKILHNHGLALRTLFQTAMLLDRREGNEYNWLTKEMYLIVNYFIDKWAKRWKFPESECRSRYYFGKFLLLKDHNYVEAIDELKKALELAKCKQWYTAKDSYNFLSTKTRYYLCKAYLAEADRIQKKEKLLAEELATHAIMAIWEGRAPKDIKLYCEACLRKGFYSIRLKNFQKTLTLYKKVQPYIYSLMLPELKCEMLLHQGICYLNLGNDNLAIRKLKQSIRLGEIYKLKTFHAHALVQIGKLYSKGHNTYNLAQKSFINAREIYTELNEENHVKKVNYLAAKLKSLQILPNLINLIFDSDDYFCDLLTLRAWKDQLEIFWKDESSEEIKDDTNVVTDDEVEFRKQAEKAEKTEKPAATATATSTETPTKEEEEPMDDLEFENSFDSSKGSSIEPTDIDAKVKQIAQEQLEKAKQMEKNNQGPKKRDASKQEISKRDISKKDFSKADFSKADIAKPDIAKPDISKPDISKDKDSKDDNSKFEIPKADTLKDESSKIEKDRKIGEIEFEIDTDEEDSRKGPIKEIEKKKKPKDDDDKTPYKCIFKRMP